MNERQKKILKILSEDERASVNRLTRLLGVSGVTIRQDLNFLESNGLLKRVHGGAVLKDSDDIDIRMGVNYDVKLKIAKKASEFVSPGDKVFIESGSVNALLARALVEKGGITIITSNVYIARQFRNNRNSDIILIGGIYQPVSESLVGKLAKACIDELNFSKAFIGIDGYTIKTGFTSRDLLRAEVSSHVIQKCINTFVLTDSSKFGITELTTIARGSEVNHIITDRNIESEYADQLRQSGAELIMV